VSCQCDQRRIAGSQTVEGTYHFVQEHTESPPIDAFRVSVTGEELGSKAGMKWSADEHRRRPAGAHYSGVPHNATPNSQY
jgi:hypothetical protein